jgi:hypothetical protein
MPEIRFARLSQELANINEDEATAIIATTTPWLTFVGGNHCGTGLDLCESSVTLELVHDSQNKLDSQSNTNSKRTYGAIGDGRPLPGTNANGRSNTWTSKGNLNSRFIAIHEDKATEFYDKQGFLVEEASEDFEYKSDIYDDQGFLIEKENALPASRIEAVDGNASSKVRALQPPNPATPLTYPQQPSRKAPIPLPRRERDNHSLHKNVLRNNAITKCKVLETIPEVEAEHEDVIATSSPSSTASSETSNEAPSQISPNSSFSSSSDSTNTNMMKIDPSKPHFRGLLPGVRNMSPIKVHRHVPMPASRPSRTVVRELRKLQPRPDSMQALIDARVSKMAGIRSRGSSASAPMNIDPTLKNVSAEWPSSSIPLAVGKWSDVAGVAKKFDHL